jgi:hypothetical protein
MSIVRLYVNEQLALYRDFEIHAIASTSMQTYLFLCKCVNYNMALNNLAPGTMPHVIEFLRYDISEPAEHLM